MVLGWYLLASTLMITWTFMSKCKQNCIARSRFWGGSFQNSNFWTASISHYEAVARSRRHSCEIGTLSREPAQVSSRVLCFSSGAVSFKVIFKVWNLIRCKSRGMLACKRPRPNIYSVTVCSSFFMIWSGSTEYWRSSLRYFKRISLVRWDLLRARQLAFLVL